MAIRSKKKKEEPVEELPPLKEEEIAILTFDEFYSSKQKEMDYNQKCHPDWYMVGASPDQYPKSDLSLESPLQAYDVYLKQNKEVST